MVNAVSGPQMSRSTAPPLIFIEQYHWRTHEGPILLLLLLIILILLQRFLLKLDHTIILPEVSIQKQT